MKYNAGLYEKLSSSLLCLSLDYEDLLIIKWIIRIFSSVLILFQLFNQIRDDIDR